MSRAAPRDGARLPRRLDFSYEEARAPIPALRDVELRAGRRPVAGAARRVRLRQVDPAAGDQGAGRAGGRARCCWTARRPPRPATRSCGGRSGLVFQTPELQLFAASAREDVAFGPRRLGWPEPEVAAAVDEALELVGLPPDRFGGRHPYALSGGEQRRLALAGVLAMRPRLLLLDEPFVSLDPATRRELAKILSRLRADGVTLVLATHDVDLAWALCDELLVLDAGRVAAAGPWDVGESGRRAARGEPAARAVPGRALAAPRSRPCRRRRGRPPRPRRRCR